MQEKYFLYMLMRDKRSSFYSDAKQNAAFDQNLYLCPFLGRVLTYDVTNSRIPGKATLLSDHNNEITLNPNEALQNVTPW